MQANRKPFTDSERPRHEDLDRRTGQAAPLPELLALLMGRFADPHSDLAHLEVASPTMRSLPPPDHLDIPGPRLREATHFQKGKRMSTEDYGIDPGPTNCGCTISPAFEPSIDDQIAAVIAEAEDICREATS